MHKFTVALVLDTGPDNTYVFGFVHDFVFIVNPFASECSRFEVNPRKAYGVSMKDAKALVALNKALAEAVAAAVEAGRKVLQEKLAIEDDDVAENHFDSPSSYIGISKALGDYFAAELAQ